MVRADGRGIRPSRSGRRTRVASGGPAGSHHGRVALTHPNPLSRARARGSRDGACLDPERRADTRRGRDWAATQRRGGTRGNPGEFRGRWCRAGSPGAVRRCPGPHPPPRRARCPGPLPGPGAGCAACEQVYLTNGSAVKGIEDIPPLLADLSLSRTRPIAAGRRSRGHDGDVVWSSPRSPPNRD